jgi:hypothetical protein
MKRAKITYEVIQKDNGRLMLYKDGCYTPIADTMENLSLISSLEVDLDYALKEQNNG